MNQPLNTAAGKQDWHVENRRTVDKLKTGERGRLMNVK